jgi:hypothetical protein
MKMVSIVAALTSGLQPIAAQHPKGMEVAMVCFKTGEETSGLNKICYYNCMGSQAAITISAVSLCPLTIER